VQKIVAYACKISGGCKRQIMIGPQEQPHNLCGGDYQCCQLLVKHVTCLKLLHIINQWRLEIVVYIQDVFLHLWLSFHDLIFLFLFYVFSFPRKK